jgi:membrane peptidoglycan carboxypeptidase
MPDMAKRFSSSGTMAGLALASLLMTLAAGAYAGLYAQATREVLALDLRRVDPLTGVYYDGVAPAANGTLRSVPIRSVLDIRNAPAGVAESHHCDRATPAEFGESLMPELIMASEDHRFLRHAGVDFVATLPRLLRGKGASTVTMQLARTTCLQSLALPFLRKPYEWALAAALEQNLSKETILRHYANSIYVGKCKDHYGRTMNMDGVKTAALHLFGRDDLRHLSMAEAATVVALFRAPNSMLGAAAAGDPKLLLQIRNDVLRRLVAEHPAYRERASRAAEEPLTLRIGLEHLCDRNPAETYFFGALTRSRQPVVPAPDSHVQTTLDPVLQATAAVALQRVLGAESARHGVELNGVLVAIDPQEGSVRALVGGVDRSKSELNRAWSKYFPGSVFKPFLYADAFDNASDGGRPFTAAYRMELTRGTIGGWTPADHIAGTVLPRVALAASSNRGAILVGTLIGLERACEIARLAFHEDPSCSPEVLLGGGSSQSTALAVAEAYAAFANGGNRVKARFTEDAPVERTRLFSAGAAFITVQMLRSAIGDMPGVHATIAHGKVLAGLPASAELAGKSGSTDTTLWVAVVHPRLIVVVVAATDDGRKLDGMFGGQVAGAVWADLIRNLPAERQWYTGGKFVQPDSVEQHRFREEEGCLTDDGAGVDYFLLSRLPRSCRGKWAALLRR